MGVFVRRLGCTVQSGAQATCMTRVHVYVHGSCAAPHCTRSGMAPGWSPASPRHGQELPNRAVHTYEHDSATMRPDGTSTLICRPGGRV